MEADWVVRGEISHIASSTLTSSVELFVESFRQGMPLFRHRVHGTELEQRNLALTQGSQAERLRVLDCLTATQLNLLCRLSKSLSPWSGSAL